MSDDLIDEQDTEILGLKRTVALQNQEILELKNSLAQCTEQLNSIPDRAGGGMCIVRERIESLNKTGFPNSEPSAMDFDGEKWAIAIRCSEIQLQDVPWKVASYELRKWPYLYGLRICTMNEQEFKTHASYPLLCEKILVVRYSPFLKNQIFTGCEDGRAFVIENGTVQKEWKIPNSPAIRAASWITANNIVIGLGNGRIFEYTTNSVHQPIRDYSRGIGQSPIIMTRFLRSSHILIACSNTRLMAYKNGQEYDLMIPLQGEFDKILAIAFDEASLHFAVTLHRYGNIDNVRHELFQLSTNAGNQKVTSTACASWQTAYNAAFNWIECLFSLKNSLYSIVSTANGIAVHDWSKTKRDLHVGCRASILDIRATSKSETSKNIVVLGQKNLFYLNFGLTSCIYCDK